MPIIRPRLNDYYSLPFTQEEVDFAIPFLDEDLPFYLDPFLLWGSPSQQDNALHTDMTNSFNYLGHLFTKGKEKDAIGLLIGMSECYEVGFGDSKKRVGVRIGEKMTHHILSLYNDIPQINKSGFIHFEEIQLLADNVSKDRVSDIACVLIKSFLIDYTIEQCEKFKIPLSEVQVDLFSNKQHKFIEEKVQLPQNPETKQSIILVPRRWLRYLPWINCEDYFDNYFKKKVLSKKDTVPDRVALLNYNRHNYGVVQNYIKIKERQQTDCKNDPLFEPIPILSTKRRLSEIKKLPTGKTENADRKYEDNVCSLVSSLVYPQLDFAKMQSRTVSGVLIRDLIFYNNRSFDFLKDIYDEYECFQIVMELKNVKTLDRMHINQLNRYMNNQFGRFGIIITRNKPPNKVFKNTVDLWSGQRKCIIILDDSDIELMCQVYESKQRLPVEVIKKKYVEFIRACPG